MFQFNTMKQRDKKKKKNKIINKIFQKPNYIPLSCYY